MQGRDAGTDEIIAKGNVAHVQGWTNGVISSRNSCLETPRIATICLNKRRQKLGRVAGAP